MADRCCIESGTLNPRIDEQLVVKFSTEPLRCQQSGGRKQLLTQRPASTVMDLRSLLFLLSISRKERPTKRSARHLLEIILIGHQIALAGRRTMAQGTTHVRLQNVKNKNRGKKESKTHIRCKTPWKEIVTVKNAKKTRSGSSAHASESSTIFRPWRSTCPMI